MKVDFHLKNEKNLSTFLDCFVSVMAMSERSHLLKIWRVIGCLKAGETQVAVACGTYWIIIKCGNHDL